MTYVVQPYIPLNLKPEIFKRYSSFWAAFMKYIMSVKLQKDEFEKIHLLHKELHNVSFSKLQQLIQDRNSVNVFNLFCSILPLEKSIPDELLAYILAVLHIEAGDLAA